jgi:putative tryptophan/tyrosine transport system substrate-binding protein
MKSKFLFCLLITVLLIAGLAQAQQQKRVSRIGYLSNSDPAQESSRSKAIGQALRELGYIEGQNIATEYRYTEGKPSRASEYAVELVRLKVDVIVVAGGPTWVQAAKNTTTTIPIVMVGAGADPVEAGLVESLARPGGNVTGLTTLNTGLGAKRLELLKEAVPRVTRVAALHDTANPITVLESKEVLRVAARALGLTVRFWEVSVADDFDAAFAAISKERLDALFLGGGGPIIPFNRKRIVDFTVKNRLPSVGNREFVNAGGLIYYGADLADSYRRVATYIDKILKGAKPADLPVEQPTKFELVINLKTAKQIGLTIPPNVLARADKVIK